MSSLLPPNATPLERAIEAATDRKIPVPVGDLWSPDRCPAAQLPWLAWALSVDDWDAVWSEEIKRAVIAAAIDVHRHKGTVWAIRRALEAAGYGDADIIEAASLPRLGRKVRLGRNWRLGVRDSSWADYWLVIKTPIPRRAADRIAALVTAVAPVRCRLRAISVSGVQYVLGRAVWPLGRQITLGATYKYEVTNG